MSVNRRHHSPNATPSGRPFLAAMPERWLTSVKVPLPLYVIEDAGGSGKRLGGQYV